MEDPPSLVKPYSEAMEGLSLSKCPTKVDFFRNEKKIHENDENRKYI